MAAVVVVVAVVDAVLLYVDGAVEDAAAEISAQKAESR